VTTNPDRKHLVRTVNILPQLDPPPPGEDKLDRLLRWLKDQGI
jgi:hypothetical protein